MVLKAEFYCTNINLPYLKTMSNEKIWGVFADDNVFGSDHVKCVSTKIASYLMAIVKNQEFPITN